MSASFFFPILESIQDLPSTGPSMKHLYTGSSNGTMFTMLTIGLQVQAVWSPSC